MTWKPDWGRIGGLGCILAPWALFAMVVAACLSR
jgi:hypothetical protein